VSKQWYGKGIQRWWKVSMWAAFTACMALPVGALIFTWTH
jgi:hypothetical protein